MARGMERTPGNYASWEEERLRDALLVLLGAHYEGRATGESFNESGKTDILVRVEDRNVFVAECKWWSGPAAFAEPEREEPSALDHLLGYTTWRDAKLALVMFVSRKDMTRVMASAHEALVLTPRSRPGRTAPKRVRFGAASGCRATSSATPTLLSYSSTCRARSGARQARLTTPSRWRGSRSRSPDGSTWSGRCSARC